MSSALQRRGYHGTGLAELLAEADAPKGVLYHHFPGGKSALAVASIEATIGRIAAGLARQVEREGDVVAGLRSFMAGAQKQLAAGDFERGCPLATVALESTAEDVEVRAALANGFSVLRGHISAALAATGVSAAQSRQLASLAISTYEGALMQARVAGSLEPMTDAMRALIAIVQQAVDAASARR